MVKKITLREAYFMFRWLNFEFLKHVKIPLKSSISMVWAKITKTHAQKRLVGVWGILGLLNSYKS